MQTSDDLIPRAPAVRERLARALREARILRRQLRVSEAAAEERNRQATPEPRHEAHGREASHVS
jgi:hypothetical protein